MNKNKYDVLDVIIHGQKLVRIEYYNSRNNDYREGWYYNPSRASLNRLCVLMGRNADTFRVGSLRRRLTASYPFISNAIDGMDGELSVNYYFSETHSFG